VTKPHRVWSRRHTVDGGVGSKSTIITPMRIAWIVVLAATACRGGASIAAAGLPDARNAGAIASPQQTNSPAPKSATTKPPTYYQQADLRSLAAHIKPLKKERQLLCGEEGSKNCVCLEPLPCESQSNCIGFQENVDAFRKTLAAKTPGRSVDCRRAEIGTCGSFRYFDFEGDIARREMRWFDENGRLVAQRNSTDYEEYCGGTSRTRFQGKVPRCEKMARTELICGVAEGDLPLPIEDVLKRRISPQDVGNARP
jgi:hypothetical protein